MLRPGTVLSDHPHRTKPSLLYTPTLSVAIYCWLTSTLSMELIIFPSIDTSHASANEKQEHTQAVAASCHEGVTRSIVVCRGPREAHRGHIHTSGLNADTFATRGSPPGAITTLTSNFPCCQHLPVLQQLCQPVMEFHQMEAQVLRPFASVNKQRSTLTWIWRVLP